ncbi:MAG TPA: ATP-binding protein, partial [Rubrivivax sp.]|nr:ATP-binding protein [Rubrivivax sp.]
DGGQRLANLVRAPVVVAALAGSGAHEPIALPRPDGQGSLQVLLGVRGAGQRLVMSLDVTAREQAEAMRRDFVANVSHEIRTPLTVLSGFIESMHRLPMTVEERERVLGLMGQQARRLQALVTDLLALSRLEGSPRPAVDQWFELDPLLQRVRADAEHSSGGRHRLSFTGPAGLHLAGNEAELHSALDNLIVNALRYTPEGGSVDLRWTLRDDGSFQAEVLDTGIGIAREHLPRLTERFYRVDSSRSRDSGGTGLGLAIVKHVVQRHGGDLDIRSEPGVGSRFTLVLPALRARQSAARDPVPARL